MRYATARKLALVDVNDLPLEALQRHRVRLIDAWRESCAEYEVGQAVHDGFYVRVLCDQATGYAPRDIFLTQNLKTAYERAVQREPELLRGENC